MEALQIPYTEQLKNKGKRKLLFDVVYVSLYQRIYKTYKESYPYLIYFVISSTNSRMKNGMPDQDIIESFFNDIKKFMQLYSYNVSSYEETESFICWIKEKEQYAEESERLFVWLTFEWFYHSDMIPKTRDCTLEQVIDYVLEFIEEYADYGYKDNLFLMSLFTEFMQDKMQNM